MKTWLLIIALALVAQSVPAAGCESVVAHMDSPHAQHEGGDCCDAPIPAGDESCPDASECGVCPHAGPALVAFGSGERPWAGAGPVPMATGRFTGPSPAPPHRPPIS